MTSCTVIARWVRRLAHARHDDSAGFTLVEVIVALAILGVAVVASIQGFAGGLRLLKLSGDHQQAMLLADQKVREAMVPEEGRKEGTEGPFAWERTISVVPAPDLEGTTGTGPKWRVFRIEVKVKWENRSVQLATLRTMPIAPAGTTATVPGTTATTPGSATTGRTTTPTTPGASTGTSPR
jgi:prepilin-type N-terminal cleavage/methylation domain-containing protein